MALKSALKNSMSPMRAGSTMLDSRPFYQRQHESTLNEVMELRNVKQQELEDEINRRNHSLQLAEQMAKMKLVFKKRFETFVRKRSAVEEDKLKRIVFSILKAYWRKK